MHLTTQGFPRKSLPGKRIHMDSPKVLSLDVGSLVGRMVCSKLVICPEALVFSSHYLSNLWYSIKYTGGCILILKVPSTPVWTTRFPSRASGITQRAYITEVLRVKNVFEGTSYCPEDCLGCTKEVCS